ncbi:MAG: Yip1 family protein [Pseudomonadota bacterium]
MTIFLSLVMLSIREPRTAAAQIIGLGLPRGAIWSALVLFAAINAIITTLPMALSPIAPADVPEGMEQLVRLLQSPLVLFVLLAGFLVVMVHALTWTGRALGGTGGLDEMAAAFAWLQALRAIAQVVLLILASLIPGIAGLVGLAIFVLGIWIMMNFVAEAQNFDSPWQAFGVLMTVFVGLMIGLMLLLTLTGTAATFGAGNV